MTVGLLAIGCGARTAPELHGSMGIDAQAGADDAGTDTAVDTGPSPGDPTRVAELLAPCDRPGNSLVLQGYVSATLFDVPFSVSGSPPSIHIDVNLGGHPYVTADFSSESFGDLQSKLYTNTANCCDRPAGRPGLTISRDTFADGGDGWFKIIDIRWIHPAFPELASLTVVFEQAWFPSATEESRIFGCLHYERP